MQPDALPPVSHPQSTPPSDPSLNSQPGNPRILPLWRLALPLGIQILIVLGIPAQHALTLATGTTIFLQTAPVDPYDLLRGRYVTLDYPIARLTTLKNLATWKSSFADGGTLYVTLAPDPKSIVSPPTWKAVAVSRDYPLAPQPQEVVIKGTLDRYGWQVNYGLGAYYIPETIGDQLEQDIRDNRETARVEVKVDPQGNAALVRVWVKDGAY